MPILLTIIEMNALSIPCVIHSEKGFCVRGELCMFDHGTDPVIVENVPRYPPPPHLGGPPPPHINMALPPPGFFSNRPPPPHIHIRPGKSDFTFRLF